MKRFLTTLLAICLLSLSLPLFASCGKESGVTTLYVYNWGEYISDGSEGSTDVNAAFEEWCAAQGMKVKVNYSTFSSNEDMYAKLCSGATAYDIVIPSDYMIERLLKEGMLRPLKSGNEPRAGHQHK